MKTNLLAQNDNLVIENLKADVGKSVMDLSHSTTFPVDVDGGIYPICCIETVPSDSFEINVECLLRQLSPLKVPLMTNLRLNTAFYYCDNRLAWKKWDRFMTGGRSGNETYDIPRCANFLTSSEGQANKFDMLDVGPTSDNYFKNIKLNNTIHTYFGISLNHKLDSYPTYSDALQMNDELPVAFPFFDYQMICRDYYTNVDRLPQNPKTGTAHYDFDDLTADWAYNNLFPSDEDEIKLVDGVQLHTGFDTGDDSSNHTHGFILDKIRYHDVRPDYFTTSKKAPMRGTAPSLNATTSTITLPSGTKLELIKNNNDNMFTKNGNASKLQVTSTALHSDYAIPTIYTISSDESSSYYDKASDDTYRNLETDPNFAIDKITAKTKENISLSGTLSNNVTAADLRLLSQLTVWQELNMLHEPYYNDFLNAHFDGVRVGESPVEKPQYIGGTSQLISINEILQTSQTTTGATGSPLGNQGATAMSLANNHVGRYYCNNYGYIIGVAYIIPEMMYKPAMPRGFSRRTKEDYYSPEFANLSMQATLNKEIFFSNDNDWNNAPWGYTGAYDELRSIPNRIAGDLLNSSYTDLQKWVLTREMANDNLPAMESTWLSLKGNVDKTAWAVQNMPVFMLQCANYIKAVRPMPKVAIPKAL